MHQNIRESSKRRVTTVSILFSGNSFLLFLLVRFHTALFSALEQTHCARTWFYMSDLHLYIARFLISTEVVCLQCCRKKLLPSRSVLCTPYNHALCHFMKATCIRKVHVCLAVTCHLYFWQSDQDLLHATAVTREWKGSRNMSQHTKLTL